MTAYLVNHRYRSWCNGVRFDWQPGQVVDLSPAQAAWANHDSAGVLSLVEIPAEPLAEEPSVAASEPAPVVGSAEDSEPDPGAESAESPVESPAEVPAAPAEPEPAPKRRGRPPKAR